MFQSHKRISIKKNKCQKLKNGISYKNKNDKRQNKIPATIRAVITKINVHATNYPHVYILQWLIISCILIYRIIPNIIIIFYFLRLPNYPPYQIDVDIYEVKYIFIFLTLQNIKILKNIKLLWISCILSTHMTTCSIWIMRKNMFRRRNQMH